MTISHRLPVRQAMVAALAALVAVLLSTAVAVVPAHAEEVGTVSVGGQVWDDANHNGHKDEDEQPLADLYVVAMQPGTDPIEYLYLDGGNPAMGQTDANGNYRIDGLPVPDGGAYTIGFYAFQTPGYQSTTGQPVTPDLILNTTTGDLSAAGASDLGVDFLIAPSVSVGGQVWDDTDHDGHKDDGEQPLAGMYVGVMRPGSDPVESLYLDGGNPVLGQTDADGNYRINGLPVPDGGAYTLAFYTFQEPDFQSTTGLPVTPDGGLILNTTTADLSAVGNTDFGVDFALAQGDGTPGGGDGGDGTGPDWLVMPDTHADVLFPELDTAQDGSQTLKMRARVDGYDPMDWNDLVIWNRDAVKETLPAANTATADYSFIAPPGSTVYRSREGGAVPGGSPWVGAALQSPTLAGLDLKHPFSFRLDAVTGHDGGAAPGDVVLWQGSVPRGSYPTMFSTRKGLPDAWSFENGYHTHFNWSFTAPGVYCMAFSVQTTMPDGTRQKAHGQLTQIVGSEYDPTTIAPCGRTQDYPAVAHRTVKAPTQAAPVISYRQNAALTLALRGGKLAATYDQEDDRGAGPATSYSVDDVIMYGRAGDDWPYRLAGTRTVTWDTAQIDDDQLDGDITWSVDAVHGPGDLLVQAPGEWSDEKFDTGRGIDSQRLWAEAKRENLRWEVTRPGKYCVDMTWTAKTAAGDTVGDHHVLTLVAEGPLDPDDSVYVGDDQDPSHVSQGEVWRAADHHALDQTCAQGGTPTRPDEVPVPGDGAGADDSAWNVPNWSTTDSGARILNDGHLDIASTLDDGIFDTQIKDTTDAGRANATHDGASWEDPGDVVLQLLPGSETSVPTSSAYSFLGKPGDLVWEVSQTQQPGLVWPGWSTETIPLDATQTGVDWTLTGMTGPGDFALFVDGQTLGSVDVLYNTRDGITSADSFRIAKHAHVHGSWAFTAEGTYCLAFSRSTTLADGTKARDPFTLAVAVGRTDVRKVDPATCAADTAEPPPATGQQPGGDHAGGAQTPGAGITSGRSSAHVAVRVAPAVRARPSEKGRRGRAVVVTIAVTVPAAPDMIPGGRVRFRIGGRVHVVSLRDGQARVRLWLPGIPSDHAVTRVVRARFLGDDRLRAVPAASVPVHLRG